MRPGKAVQGFANARIQARGIQRMPFVFLDEQLNTLADLFRRGLAAHGRTQDALNELPHAVAHILHDLASRDVLKVHSRECQAYRVCNVDPGIDKDAVQVKQEQTARPGGTKVHSVPEQRQYVSELRKYQALDRELTGARASRQTKDGFALDGSRGSPREHRSAFGLGI